MPLLPDVQREFASALQDARHAAAAAAMFRGMPQRVLARLAVYRGNVHANCTKALACAYPVIQKIVGEDFFDAMAREYARAIPSRSGDLNLYGEALGDFVASFPHTRDLPYLPDVARMEWLVHRAHFAQDSPPFDPSPLASLHAERFASLKPRLSAACTLLESPWPLARIWTIHQDDYHGLFEIDLNAGPDRLLVYRTGWHARVLSLAPGDFSFLASAAHGATLGSALEAGVAAERSFDPSTTLARWMDAQVITGLV
jgi:uncharacterized protein